MKICVTSTEASLDAQVDPRFGRTSYFIIVDSETMTFEAVSNTAVHVISGAGIQAAQTIAAKEVKIVITGNVGPNAFQALASAGIKVVTSASGTVREVIERYKRGELRETRAPTVGGHFGRSRAVGRQRGRKRQP